MITGYYDRVTNSADRKSINICYFNHVVNLQGGDPNDVSKYTKENYTKELKSILRQNPDTMFFIHLPVFQVYNNPDGSPITLVDWWSHIYTYTHKEINVAGYYVADEPEIYGTEYSDQSPYPYELVLKWKRGWYDTLSKEEKTPLLAVFCDPDLLFKKKGILNTKYKYIGTSFDWWMYSFGIDIFGFDLYPLQTQEHINKRGLGFTVGSDKEWEWIDAQFRKWILIMDEVKLAKRQTMYVGQGCGSQDWAGEPNWGQRDFTEEELRRVFELYKKHHGMPDYHILWSYSRCDITTALRSNFYLENIFTEVELPRKTSTFLHKISGFIKRLFTWKN